MSFLPPDYKAPASPSPFMKFEEGVQMKFRILSDALIGWEGWRDNKPFRRLGIEQNITEDEVDIDTTYKKPKINHFWAFLVYNYQEKKVQILEITQKTVMTAIEKLVDDEDWGDPKKYDLSVEKVKDSKRTSYSVKPYPPKKASAEVEDALENSTIDLEEVFLGDDQEDKDGFKKRTTPKRK
jgi:hypothetical protein